MENKIRYLYIETTNRCNLNCSFCNRNIAVNTVHNMSIDDYKKILDKIKDYPINEAKLMGMGEPFLHPDYSLICKMFKDYFPNAITISSTNCQYQINDNFKNALKYLDILYLSIDGYEENYERFRKGAKWDILINFLEDLITIERYNCKIVINYVVNPNNIMDIQKVHDNIFKKYNLSDLRINIAQNWSENETTDLNYTEEQINFLKNQWGNNIKGKSIWTYSDCFWVNDGLYISSNGDVKVCRLNTTSTPIGNIIKDNIEDIRKNEKFLSIKNGCLSNTPDEHCLNCSYSELVPILSKIKKRKKIIAFDLDGTLCERPNGYEHLGPKKYDFCTPINNMIEIVNQLYDKGYKIVIYTARGMSQFNGDVDKVYEELYEITSSSLLKWGVKYDDLIMGKIDYDMIVDDKAMGIDDLDKIRNL